MKRIVVLSALLTVECDSDEAEIKRTIGNVVQKRIDAAMANLPTWITYYYGASVQGFDVTAQLDCAREADATPAALAPGERERDDDEIPKG